MPRAVCMIRDAPHYRADAFRRGLKAAGYDLSPAFPRSFGRDDVLVIWNRYGFYDAEARLFEAAGAAVIVAENGIIGASENEYAKQYDAAGDQLYCLALSYHNGAGRWPVGEPGRWRSQGIEVQPWREDGEAIVLLEQRGFGPPEVAPPKDWTETILAKLKRLTHRPIRVRRHPGNYPAKTPLAEDLADAYAVVTHGSGAGIKAMVAGIRCYSTWPRWLGFPSAIKLDLIGRADVNPTDEAREAMLDRLAWAQWTAPEIASGEPFRRLMDIPLLKQRGLPPP